MKVADMHKGVQYEKEDFNFKRGISANGSNGCIVCLFKYL